MTVANVDVCACCGTHVERCGQVGSIKLTSSQSYKGGTRVTMLCGMRAYEDHCIKFQNAEAVSGLLSAKINETAAAVQRLADENAALRKRPRWRPVCLRRTPPRSAAEKMRWYSSHTFPPTACAACVRH